jgi:ribose-phosphate pyrophosphokinase
MAALVKLSAAGVKDLVAFYPDEGSMKRYSGMVNLPYAFGIKKRNWETGKIEGLDVAGAVDQIAGKDILIVDDICSRGGTFYHSAKKLKDLGANDIYLYVSHCENTIFEGDLLKGDLIKKVYTTDSIFTKEHEKIEVLK